MNSTEMVKNKLLGHRANYLFIEDPMSASVSTWATHTYTTVALGGVTGPVYITCPEPAGAEIHIYSGTINVNA